MAVNDQSEIILIPQGMLPWHQFLMLLTQAASGTAGRTNIGFHPASSLTIHYQ